jgi:hypothetical protein
MNLVDPHPVHLSQGFNVRVGGQKLRLETSHLAGRSGLSFDGFTANDPPHGGITAQSVGVVHVVVPAKASENGLAKQPRHAVSPVLAGPAVLEKTPGNFGQAKGIVKLPIGEESSVRRNLGTMEFKLEAAVEIDPQMGVS